MYEHSNKNIILGIDVGGSHITSALVNATDYSIVDGSMARGRVEKNGSKEIILKQWINIIEETLDKMPAQRLAGIGFAMPGPFNYEEGICLMQGVNKYESLYNFNINNFIKKQFLLEDDFPVKFENDASCFGLGESMQEDVCLHEKLIAVTLGTGFGATFLQNNTIRKDGDDVPALGQLYDQPYLDGIAEDYVSTAWLLKEYNKYSNIPVTEVKDIAEKAMAGEENALQVLETFGKHFAACIIPWIKKFGAQCLVIGGSIAKSAQLFTAPLYAALEKNNIQLKIKISTLMEISAITGAASLVHTAGTSLPADDSRQWRKSSQALLPAKIENTELTPGEYDIYPFYNIGENAIFSGYESLTKWITDKKTVSIDGYGGNDWEAIKEKLDEYFQQNNLNVQWTFTSSFLKPEAAITEMVTPFLGEPGAVWGTRTSLTLKDFYNTDDIAAIKENDAHDIQIVIGTGAALSQFKNIIYV
ncbi:MAG: ROK family protein, partial [Sphingobacteriales bacterium]